MAEILPSVVQSYLNGATVTSLAESCGRSRKWFYKLLSEYGIYPQRCVNREQFKSVEDDPLTPVIRALFNSGMTVAAICKEFKKSKPYVGRRIVRQERDLRRLRQPDNSNDASGDNVYLTPRAGR